jgi:mannose-1-phosphate guanylyltransferase / mannose-6-phosphate isomerase
MKEFEIIPIVLSGGLGSRLWPMSRGSFPKQYLSIFDKFSMFQKTILRLNRIRSIRSPVVVCNEDHRFIVANMLKEIALESSAIILEPVGRNTAPAIVAATLNSTKSNSKNSLILVLPSDHLIEDEESFCKLIEIAREEISNNQVITFGVTPTEPNTGYGYIKYSDDKCVNGLFDTKAFIEKPCKEVAEDYLKSGKFLWNSGIFMCAPETLLNGLNNYFDTLIEPVRYSLENSTMDFDFIRLNKQYFKSSVNISIDNALLESFDNIKVMKLDVGWSDAGTWPSLYKIGKKDYRGNVVKGDVFCDRTFDSYINSSNRMIATIGVKDLVIVDTQDVVFIADINKSHEIDNIMKLLRKNKRDERNMHKKIYRPWGWYKTIESGSNFQIKKLHVNLKSKLSLQKHSKRSEHWFVVKGIADVVLNESSFTLKPGQSTYISVGDAHSLENKQEVVLEVIEVQSGSYLGEDDIVRLSDIYNRV